MNVEAFKRAYAESRNGANHFVRHPLVRGAIYSDGVQACAEAGCHWLVDILLTELPKPLRQSGEYLAVIKVNVTGSKAEITASVDDDNPRWYVRPIDFTDMPEGEWTFFMGYDGPEFGCRLILPTEY